MGIIKFMFCFFQVLTIQVSSDISIRGNYNYNQYTISYGNVMNSNQDGYLEIKNNDTEDIIEIIYDSEGHETFKYIADMGDDIFFIICDRYVSSINYELPKYKDTIILKCNLNGNIIDELVLRDKPLSYYNHNNILLLMFDNDITSYIDIDFDYVDSTKIKETYSGSFSIQAQGFLYVDGISVSNISLDYPGYYNIKVIEGNHEFSYSLTLKSNVRITGEKFNEMFIGDVVIDGSGELFLNNQSYIAGDKVSIPGYYDLVIYGKNNYEETRSFVILPEIKYAISSGIYDFVDYLELYEPVFVYSDGVSMLLNGDIYEEKLIDSPGSYELIVNGVNGMQFNLHFCIYPSVIGVKDQQIYETVEINVFGKAKLNGELITGNNLITNPGSYCLELLMDDEIYETYYFTIESIKVEKVESDKLNFNLVFILISIIGAILIFRKK